MNSVTWRLKRPSNLRTMNNKSLGRSPLRTPRILGITYLIPISNSCHPERAGVPDTRGPQRALLAGWGEATGLRRWGDKSKDLQLSLSLSSLKNEAVIPSEPGPLRQVFVAGVMMSRSTCSCSYICNCSCTCLCHRAFKANRSIASQHSFTWAQTKRGVKFVVPICINSPPSRVK